MTYNFDPERWFEIELAALDERLERGEIDSPAHGRMLEDLQRRLEDLRERIHAPYDYRNRDRSRG
ncbi:MAG: hypothetical protein R6V85_21305 [Polyangia bacterium]